MSLSPKIAAEYRRAEEAQNLHDGLMQDRILALDELISGNPDLNAKFKIATSGSVRLSPFSLGDVKTVDAMNAGARKIEKIIGADGHYSLDDRILLEIAFGDAACDGRKLGMEYEGNRLIVSFGPRPR